MPDQKTIGVDIRVLSGGRRTGVEQYLLGLLPAMIELAPQVKFKLFFSSWQEENLSFPWQPAGNVEFYRFRYPNRFLFASARLVNRPFVDRLIGGADVFFSPHFFLAPVSRRCHRVITFHDLSFVRHPDFFSRRKNIWHRFQMNPCAQARRADRIIADSCSTRNDLISLFGLPAEKIRVIYPGVSKNQEFDLKRCDQREINRVCTKYRLSPDRYFLFLGTMEPRKNIPGILRAFDYLRGRKELPEDSHLVIAGEAGWKSRETLKFLQFSPWRKFVHLAGRVDEEDKPLVYALARVFVYPSFFEGFGFPPLEAMHYGLPVVTSRVSSLPEVAANAALLVDPYNLKELAGAMKILFNDEKMRHHCRQAGYKRAASFSWQKAAEKTLKVLDF